MPHSLQERRRWLAQPTRKGLITAGSIWLVGNTLQVLAITGLEPQRLFEQRNVGFYGTFILSTWIMVHMARNYVKRRRTGAASAAHADPSVRR